MTPSTLNPPVLDNYRAVVAEFCEFLTVAVHTILYERGIYPRTSFLSARKYNYPVRQNRHPKVCKWIQDAVAAVQAELLKVCHTFFATSFGSASLAVVEVVVVRSPFVYIDESTLRFYKLLFSYTRCSADTRKTRLPHRGR